MSPATFVGTLAIGLALSTPARADDDPVAEYAVEARPHVKAALDGFARANYEASITEWQAAYAIDKNPQLLYGLAQAERFAKRCSSAIEHYRQFLKNNVSDNAAIAARGAISLCTEGEIEIESPSGPKLVWYKDPYKMAIVGGSIGVVVGLGFLIASTSATSRAHTMMTLDGFQNALDDATLYRRLGWTTLLIGAGVGIGAVVYHYKFSASATPSSATVAIGGTF